LIQTTNGQEKDAVNIIQQINVKIMQFGISKNRQWIRGSTLRFGVTRNTEFLLP